MFSKYFSWTYLFFWINYFY